MKPHLVVTERRGEVPVRGTCSACPGEIFAPPVMGDSSYNLAMLEELFDEHFKKVHLREDDMSRTTPNDYKSVRNIIALISLYHAVTKQTLSSSAH
jgi:hypothetical protein